MKGVIFNVLENFIVDGWGVQAYDDILAMCPLATKGVFVGPASYPDADLFTIVGQACARLEVSLPVALRAFGRYLGPRLAARVPTLVAAHHHPKSFLMSIDDIIHVEVRKLFRDAQPPRLTTTDTGPDTLTVHYASSRNLCGLVSGLLDGTSDLFGVAIAHDHVRCRADGAPTCDFELRFGPAREQAA